MSAPKQPSAPVPRRTLPLLVVALASAYLALAVPSSARGTSFTVDSTLDAVDANPGDGVCATAAAECTLRAAVQETNVVPGPNIIILPPGAYLLSIDTGFEEDMAASDDLDITDGLELKGAGPTDTTIDGVGIGGSNVEIWSATVIMSDLTITNGGHPLGRGGAILNLGGTLTLNDAIIRDNIAGTGSGIANHGTLTVNGGAFIHNGRPGHSPVGRRHLQRRQDDS